MQIEERILDLWIDREEWEQLIKQYLSFSLENGSGEIRLRRRLTEQAGSPQRAMKIFSAVEDRLEREVDPVRKKYLNQLGSDLLLEAGQARRAVDFITESFKGSSEIGIRLYTLGTELENRGEVALALEAWSRVPEGVAFYHQARFQMATTSLQEKEYEKARQGATGLIAYMADRYVPSLAATPQSATLSACLNRLQGHNRQTFRKALMILAEVELARKQPGRALKWINPLKEQTSPGEEDGRLELLEGHAYSQLGSLDMAEEAYQQAFEEASPGSAAASEAGYFLAECFLWREKTPEALNAYFNLAQGAPEAPFSNEAIRRYMVLSFAGAEQLYQYSLATLFEWKGDNEEAVRLYREAASHESDREIGGWCLFEAARLLQQSGRKEAARKQAEFIIENYEHPTLLAECRMLLAQLSDISRISAPADLEEATGPYATLLMQHPDTLYSDLVRLKMEGRLEDPF
jgi:tetratricopeptide (TPR) repeat protein